MTTAERAKRNATNHALRALPSLADAHKYGWAAKTRREWRSAYRYVRLLSDQAACRFAYLILIPKDRTSYGTRLRLRRLSRSSSAKAGASLSHARRRMPLSQWVRRT